MQFSTVGLILASIAGVLGQHLTYLESGCTNSVLLNFVKCVKMSDFEIIRISKKSLRKLTIRLFIAAVKQLHKGNRSITVIIKIWRFAVMTIAVGRAPSSRGWFVSRRLAQA